MTRGILRRIDKDTTVGLRALGNTKGHNGIRKSGKGTGHVTLQIVRILREGAWPITRM